MMEKGNGALGNGGGTKGQSKYSELRDMEVKELLRQPALQTAMMERVITQMDRLDEISSTIKAGRGLRSSDKNVVPGEETSGSKPRESAATGGYGHALVDELLNRMGTGKSKKKKYEDDDDLALTSDEDDGDEEDESQEEDAFYSRTVPQYQLKKKLAKIHFDTIENLRPSECGELCKKILPQLKDIIDGKVYSERDQLFVKCSVSRDAVRQKLVGRQFNNRQAGQVMQVIHEWFCTLYPIDEQTDQMVKYVAEVMSQEALIRIFALANGVSNEHAEKEMRFEGAYSDDLPEELVQFVENYEKENGPVFSEEKKKTIKVTNLGMALRARP